MIHRILAHLGVPREPVRPDVTVNLGSRSSTELVRTLASAGFELRVIDVEGFVESTRVLPLVHLPSRIPVDIVLAGPGLEELFFARVEERSIGALRVPVLSAEDLIAPKILAGRAKDLDDVAAVLRTRGNALDLKHVQATLRALETVLTRARTRSPSS